MYLRPLRFEINSDLNTGISSHEFTHEPNKNDNDIAVNCLCTIIFQYPFEMISLI